MRRFRRAQLRGSDELFRSTEPEQLNAPIAPGLPDEKAAHPVPAAPAPHLRSIRLSDDELQTLAEAVQHLKYPQQKPAIRPSVDDFERLEQLRQKLLDAL